MFESDAVVPVSIGVIFANLLNSEVNKEVLLLVSWVWIIPSFLFGGMFGCLITAVLVDGNNNRYDD